MPLPPVRLSAKAYRTQEQPISFFMQQALEVPGLISLAAGLVDEASLPTSEVAVALAAMFADPAAGRAALQYGATPGYMPLRERLLKRFADAEDIRPEELSLKPADVLMTSGSQQLLYLLSEALFDPGDIVITEAPSYFVFHNGLISHGVEVLAVPMDENGLRTELLEELLTELKDAGRLPRVKMIYTVDYFQNPTGLSLQGNRI